MKKWWIRLITIIALGIGMLIILERKDIPYRRPAITVNSVDYIEYEDLCEQFVRNHLMDENKGIYTNYRPSEETKEWSTGHEVLSESQGLYMMYLVNRGDKEGFDAILRYVREFLTSEDGMIGWRYNKENNELAQSNATLDDLRIIKATLLAYKQWVEEDYLAVAYKLASRLYENNVKDGKLYSCYDETYKELTSSIPLCYFDFEALNYLKEIDRRWGEVYQNSLKIVERGYLGDAFPFYAFEYDYETKIYKEANTIRMTEGILTVLHLAQVGEHRDETIEWLIKALRDGAIYGEYDKTTGKPINNTESTAIYACIAQVAKVIGDQELYDLAIDKMLLWQIQNSESVLNGAFGNEDTQEVYSYDNLQALLAF